MTASGEPRPTDKAALRAHFLAIRRAVPTDERVRAARVLTEAVVALPEWDSATTIGLYAATADEVATDELFTHAIAAGKCVAYPRALPNGTLAWHAVNTLDELSIGAFGIREPRATLPLRAFVDIDFLIVPGIAFDADGYRLGYGGGYYDRALATCKKPTCALAFACQITQKLPRDAWDVPIGRVLIA